MAGRFHTISFLSDLGVVDEHVGVVHAVLRDLAPHVAVVDLTHQVPAYDVRAGSLALARAIGYVPSGVVLAAVDARPVDRPMVAIEVANGEGVLVGPDNGLLAPAVAMAGGAERAVLLTDADYHLSSPGGSFPVRDVLAPVAAHLCNGVDLAELGEPVEAAPSEDADAAGPEITPDMVITDLRGKIERLGPVNMMAIGQFDELEQRHTFLTTQRKDLLDAIQQTGEAIKRIDKTTKERFEEAFHSINEKFQVMFSTVFGGGRATLLLIDQENETESGIDIQAQPPGKRLQNVQLLSGGEKALTAMSLMFAIFKFRPSPFCLLDEIDAPLDDANIGRFVDMLKTMQDHTQFILITHNRKTMEIANRLYGVTMEEPGVSKLISIQMN